MKPRIGFFDFAGCEGCQLTVLNLEDQFLELLDLVEIVEFREVATGGGVPLDIAFVEGSIGPRDEIERLRQIRKKSKILVALGACADTAGINSLSHYQPAPELQRAAYGDVPSPPAVALLRPLHDFVAVDHRLPGCPIDGDEFLAVLQALLLGRPPELPGHSVCVECKLAELPCVFEFGQICLGPIARAGCGARCVQGGSRCRGCRGEMENPRTNPYYRILTDHGLTEEEIRFHYRLFNLPEKEDR